MVSATRQQLRHYLFLRKKWEIRWCWWWCSSMIRNPEVDADFRVFTYKKSEKNSRVLHQPISNVIRLYTRINRIGLFNSIPNDVFISRLSAQTRKLSPFEQKKRKKSSGGKTHSRIILYRTWRHKNKACFLKTIFRHFIMLLRLELHRQRVTR